MNEVILIGRLGRDSELKYTKSGAPVLNFSMATTKKWGKGDQKQEKTIWHNVVQWGKIAESLAPQLKKGCKVLIKGEVDQESWEDQNGNKQRKTIITAFRVEPFYMANANTQQRQQSNQHQGHWQDDTDYNQDTQPNYTADDTTF